MFKTAIRAATQRWVIEHCRRPALTPLYLPSGPGPVAEHLPCRVMSISGILHMLCTGRRGGEGHQVALITAASKSGSAHRSFAGAEGQGTAWTAPCRWPRGTEYEECPMACPPPRVGRFSLQQPGPKGPVVLLCRMQPLVLKMRIRFVFVCVLKSHVNIARLGRKSKADRNAEALYCILLFAYQGERKRPGERHRDHNNHGLSPWSAKRRLA